MQTKEQILAKIEDLLKNDGREANPADNSPHSNLTEEELYDRVLGELEQVSTVLDEAEKILPEDDEVVEYLYALRTNLAALSQVKRLLLEGADLEVADLVLAVAVNDTKDEIEEQLL